MLYSNMFYSGFSALSPNQPVLLLLSVQKYLENLKLSNQSVLLLWYIDPNRLFNKEGKELI